MATINIKTSTGRAALTPAREPSLSQFDVRGHLGYRAGADTWLAKHRDPATGKRLGKALGKATQSGTAAYDEMAAAAREWFVTVGQGVVTDWTVKDACDSYLQALLAAHRNDAHRDAQTRVNAKIADADIARIKLNDLRQHHVQDWLNGLLKPDTEDDNDVLRRSKDSANRDLACLKAALNSAYRAQAVLTDRAWKTVTKFPGVGRTRRDAYLTVPQRKALLNACPDDLKLLVKGALLTGFRPGELAALKVADLVKATGTIRVEDSKTGYREVAISREAMVFFVEQAKDKLPSAYLLTRADGAQWSKDKWKDPFPDARKAAGLPAGVVLYSCRHTRLSDLVMAGVDLLSIAKLAGTSIEMIEKNYGHLRKQHLHHQLDRVAAGV